jgi:hypothetical protein
MFFATSLRYRRVVELADNTFANFTGLEAEKPSVYDPTLIGQGAHRAKPTPRPVPLGSRRILLEQTLCGAKIAPSSCIKSQR